MICPQEGKKKEKVPGFFYNLKQMNPFAKKQPKERDPEAAATAPAEDGDKEESKELLEKGGEEKGDEDKEGEKKEEDAEKKEEGENIRIICN